MGNKGAATLIPTEEEGGGGGGPRTISFINKGTLGIKDVPNLVASEGSEISAIPGRLCEEIKNIIIQRKKDEHGKNYEVGNVQILERLACGVQTT